MYLGRQKSSCYQTYDINGTQKAFIVNHLGCYRIDPNNQMVLRTGLEPVHPKARDFLHTTVFTAGLQPFVRWTMPWP